MLNHVISTVNTVTCDLKPCGFPVLPACGITGSKLLHEATTGADGEETGHCCHSKYILLHQTVSVWFQRGGEMDEKCEHTS